MYARQLQVFQELDESFPQEVTQEWAKEPVEAMLNDDGKWQNPMHASETTGMWVLLLFHRFSFIHSDSAPSFKEILRENRGQETADAHVPARRLGASQWIATGIELEHNM